MELFFYLHAEFENHEVVSRSKEYGLQTAGRDGPPPPPTGKTLSVFGKDPVGRTVIVRIHQYRIHFFVSFKDSRLCEYCCTWLLRNNDDRSVVSLKTVTGFKSMLIDKEHQVADGNNYADTSLTNVIRLQVRNRKDVTAVIERIDQRAHEYCAENGVDHHSSAVRYYQSNMDFITVATRELGLDACSWSFLDTGLCFEPEDNCGGGGREYHFYDMGLKDPRELFNATSSSLTLELPVLPPPVKIMSFDIECLSDDLETMPDASRDPVIQISTVISDDALGRNSSCDVDPSVSKSHAFQRFLFTLGGICSAIADVQVFAFQNETDMLKEFTDHVQTVDPDIMTGYNIDNFDFPFLFKRMEVTGVDARMGRRKMTAVCKKRNREMVRQYASFLPKTHDTYIPGRIVFDMYTHLRKEVNLRSYTLNSVSSHFLNKKKDDVSYKEIPTLFHRDASSRARLGHYCVQDSQLVLELALKTQTFVHAFERCKVFRTMLQYLVDRGQQVKFYSLLLAWCAERRILVNDVTSRKRMDSRKNSSRNNSDDGVGRPKKRSRDDDDEREATPAASKTTSSLDKGGKTKRSGYDGATVLDPITGIYHTPVVCLDYASLYPSIMIGYNLCFTTLVQNSAHGRELCRLGAAEESPVGHVFLKRSVKKGVLPSILEMLLDKRAEVRARMKRHSPDGSIEYKLLDGQQLALKIAANSIYGAIGCDKSILHFVQIPSSVTAYGRKLILQTKERVESDFEATKVVYGDTDSVMVNLVGWDSRKQQIWECATIGNEMAASVTRAIGREPIRLQFETVYRPFLLCTKKRYAARVYNGLDKLATGGVQCDDDADNKPLCSSEIKYKGLQVVRRDNCTYSTRIMQIALESLMDEHDGGSVEKLTGRLREELALLFDGRVNTKQLVISKEWKKSGGANSAQAHDRLAQRMQVRDPNSAPSIGDRVPYVVIADQTKKLCDRAEDPLYVIENDLQVDLLYYADNQVANPIAQLLRVVMHDEKSLEEIKDMFWPANAPRRQTDKRRAPNEIAWTRKASIGSRRITDYYFNGSSRLNGSQDQDDQVADAELQKQLADVEDVLDSLADKCMACKDGEVEAIRSCRDLECETLYDRFGRLNVRRGVTKEIQRIAVMAKTTGRNKNTDTQHIPSPQPPSYSSGPGTTRRFAAVFYKQ